MGCILQLYLNYVSKQRNPDQTPRSAASDLVLHCLRMSHKKDSRVEQGHQLLNFFLEKNRQVSEIHIRAGGKYCNGFCCHPDLC